MMGGTTTTTSPDIAVVIAQLISAGWTEASDCAPDHYPHVTDCAKFYQCDHGYRSPDRACALGTLYNHVIKACDHAANVDCTRGTTAPPNTPPATEPPSTTTTGTSTSVDLIGNFVVADATEGGDCNYSEVAPNINFFVHAEKCGTYFTCDQGNIDIKQTKLIDSLKISMIKTY